MKSITQNKRYLPHEMSTKINSVKLHRQTGDIGFVVRRYHISKASLMRWNKQYDGTRESLLPKSHRPHSQHPNAHTEEELRWVRNYHRRNPNISVCELYPDFISRDSELRMIANAKYKPIDNIGNRDYLQVLAYMFRFDAKTGFYPYPEAGDSDDLKLRMNRGSTYEANVVPWDDISITKHGLKIPVDATDYAGFVTMMDASEQELMIAFR